jgi:hypothetical protein
MAYHIIIDGHEIDLDKYSIDEFYNADDAGTRVTDEQWDETQARKAAAEAAGDDYVSWIPIADWNGDGGAPGPDEE